MSIVQPVIVPGIRLRDGDVEKELEAAEKAVEELEGPRVPSE